MPVVKVLRPASGPPTPEPLRVGQTGALASARARRALTAWTLLVAVLLVSGILAWVAGEALVLFMGLVATTVSLLFRTKIRSYFLLAYLANAIAAVALSQWFMSSLGRPFAPGGDDLFFFEQAMTVARELQFGNGTVVEQVRHYSGAGYIVAGGVLLALASQLGLAGPLLLPLVNGIVGATIAPGTWLLARNAFKIDDRRAGYAALLVALYPTLTYYSAVGLRDIAIAAGTTWALYFIASVDPLAVPWRRARSSLIAAGLVLVVGMVRPASALPLAAGWFWALQVDTRSIGRLLVKVMLTAAVVVVAQQVAADLASSFARESSGYIALASAESGAGSIGLRIMTLPSPVGDVLRFAYASVAPVPPARGLSLDQLMLGGGAVVWYFVLPFLAFGLRAAFQFHPSRRAAVASGALMLSAIAGISMTSLDPRHRLPLYPVASTLAVLGAASLGPRRRTSIAAWYGLGLVGLVIAYAALKA